MPQSMRFPVLPKTHRKGGGQQHSIMRETFCCLAKRVQHDGPTKVHRENEKHPDRSDFHSNKTTRVAQLADRPSSQAIKKWK
jgi:hypothetical protein